MNDSWMDIEHVLFAAVDLYESDLTRGQSETIFYDQAERFAEQQKLRDTGDEEAQR